MKITTLETFKHFILNSFNKDLDEMYISPENYKSGKTGIYLEMDKQNNHTFFIIVRMNFNGFLMEFDNLFDIMEMDEYENYNNFEEMMTGIEDSNVMKQAIFENYFELFKSEV